MSIAGGSAAEAGLTSLRPLHDRSVRNYVNTVAVLAVIKLRRRRRADRRRLTRTSSTVYSAVADRKLCLLYTSPSPRDGLLSRMPSSA